MRIVLLVAVITAVVLSGGLLIAPSFVDWNVYKGQVTNQVHATTGRDLAIDGDLELTLIPRPTLVASGVRVGNIEGASSPEMIRLRTALVRVALVPLLRGRIAMDSVVLVQPQISLERLADGRVNWAFSEPTEDLPPADTTPPPTDGGFALPPIAFNNISIEDGTIIFRDARTGDVRRFERINATVAAGSLQGPFRAEGSFNAVGVPFGLSAEIGRLAEDRAIPVSAAANINGRGIEAEFSGVVSGFPIEPRLSGRLSGQGSELADVLGGLVGGRPPALPDAVLTFAGDLSANPKGVALTGIEFSYGETSATGSANLALEPEPSANIAINVSRIDLDGLLAGSAGQGADSEEASGGSSESPIQVVPGARTDNGFTLPQKLDATLDATIDAVVYRGGIIRQARLSGQLTNGELTISQASAQLPGGADVTLFGFVTAAENEPVFDGQIEANADNLRGLLSWLDVSSDTVPADRLRKMELTADIRATPAQLTISNTDAQIDLSRIRGGVAIALRERPGLGIGFSVDKLNLDAYLTEPAAPAESGEAPSDSQEIGDDQRPPAPGIDLSALAFLDTFDAIVQFQIGNLTYKRIPIQGVSFDGTLQAGTLQLRQASVVDLAGTTFSASGELQGLGGASPTIAVDTTLDSEDAARFLTALGLEPPPRSGPVKIEANIAGDPQDLTIDMDVQVQGLKLRAGGKLTDLAQGPSYDLRLDARHDSTAEFVGLLTGGPKSGAELGAVQITGRVVGDPTAADLDLTGQFGPGQGVVTGSLIDLASAPAADLQINVTYPDLQRLVRLFVPSYRAAVDDLGEFRLAAAAQYSPTGATLSGLQGEIGPVALQGDAALVLGGARPRITASLSTSEIVADWFAPAALAAAPAAGPATGESQPTAPRSEPRWSSEPIDLSALESIDAEVTISAPGLGYTQYSVDQPEITLALEDGKLTLRQLAGRAFDGEFSMTAEIDAKENAASKLLLSVAGADAAKVVEATQATRTPDGASNVIGGVLELLFPVSALGLQSGTIGAEFALETSGSSEFDLVSGLNGSGEMTFTNAVIEGFDVCNLSAQLDDIDGSVESVLGLALSIQGGTTKVSDFVGRFDVADGIANLPRQQLNAECAVAQISGQVDLPRWLVDLRANLTFSEHPEFPGLLVEERGSLDAPNVRLVNLNEVQAYFAARAAGTLIRELIPDDIAEPAPEPAAQPQQPATAEAPASQPPAPQPEPEEEAPADPFIKLLDTLIKNR